MTQGPISSPQPSPSGQVLADGAAHILVIDDSITILKVVNLILAKNGYRVTLAQDGGEGLERLRSDGPFDLILLDFVMPRMNGYQFCRKLRAEPEHGRVPVVLMSARTATIGDRFVEQTGAVDALAKPFDARALVAVVGNVLAKQAGDAKLRSLPSVDMMADEDDLEWEPVSQPPPSRHFRGLDRISSTIAMALTPHLQRLTPAELANSGALAGIIARAINQDVLTSVVASLDDLELEPSTEVLRGELQKLPVAEVLQLLQLRRQNGIVKVRHQKKVMTLSIREGNLELAQSEGTGEEFRIGRYVVEGGHATRAEVDAALERCPSEQLFGEFLVQEGVLDDNALVHVLANQTAELVYEVLRWPDGRFQLLDEPLSIEAEKACLNMGLSELVLEGFRRVDEWRHMSDTIDFDAVLVVDQVALGTLDDSKIGKSERPVLLAIDGKRTARDVLEMSELPSFDAIKTLYRFLQSRIVREVKAKGSSKASAPPPRPSIPPPAPAQSSDGS